MDVNTLMQQAVASTIGQLTLDKIQLDTELYMLKNENAALKARLPPEPEANPPHADQQSAPASFANVKEPD